MAKRQGIAEDIQAAMDARSTRGQIVSDHVVNWALLAFAAALATAGALLTHAPR